MNVTFETGGDGSTATTHDWLTPPEILEALGPFDMDPCASQFQPWRTAAQQFTIEDDGLAREWQGRVWCNPPYGPHAEKFLARMATHGNGIALIFARTETKAFQEHCWRSADAMLFMAGRIRFRLPGGGVSGPAGAHPSLLPTAKPMQKPCATLASPDMSLTSQTDAAKPQTTSFPYWHDHNPRA